MRILLHAYQLSPYRGSEYSVAWNYIMEMGKEHSITVLYGANGNHMGDLDPVEDYRKLIGSRDITFVPIPCTPLMTFLNQLNKHNIFVYSFYFAYHLWEKAAFRKAKQLIREQQYDLIHFLGPIGYREPGFLWKLPLPYLWGPLGGFDNDPRVFQYKMPWTGKIKNLFRSLFNTWQQKYSLSVRHAMRRSDNVLAASTSFADAIRRNYGLEACVIPENGIIDIASAEFLTSRDFTSDPFNMLWIGTIDYRKNLKVMLDALLLLPFPKDRWNLTVIGNGPLKAEMQTYAEQKGIADRIRWTGNIPRNEVLQYFRDAHCHVISSSREGNPTTIWEAMSHGVPTITFDHCGMHDTICDSCGIRVPIPREYSQLTQGLAAAIDKLYSDRALLKKLSYGAIDCAKKFTFDRRHEFFNQQYQIAIRNYQRKHNVKQ